MKHFSIFIAAGTIFLLFLSSCNRSESDDVECNTIMDCPLGWECSADNVCVEIVKADKDNALPDIDNTVSDNNSADDTVIPDEAQSDPDNAIPDEVEDEDAIVADESDEDLVEDMDFTDEDADFNDESESETDEDLISDEDSDSEDIDTDEEDTDISDEDITDDDVLVPSEVIIGEGTDTQWIPIGCRLFKYTRSASLYLSSEIGVSAPVTKLAWYDDNGASTSRPVKIYLKETTDTVLTSVTWVDQITGATEVFSGDITTVAGWNEINLTAPFNHSGTNNLLVLVEMNMGSFCNDDYPAMRYTPAADLHSAWNSDNIPAGNGSVNGSRPNIRIFF